MNWPIFAAVFFGMHVKFRQVIESKFISGILQEGDEGEDVAHDEEEAKDGDEQEEDRVKEEKETIVS